MSKTVVVSGAAGGVGTEVVKQLLAQGTRVIATVLNAAEASQLRAVNPGVAEIIELDCSNADKVRETLSARFATLDGGLQAIVVCAAISPGGPAETSSLALARKTLEINTLSGIAIYQAAMPLLRASKGRIVYMCSMAGRFGMPFISFYTASKFALEGAIESMRCEAAAFGVELVMIEPGGIQTAMMLDQIRELPGTIEKLGASERTLYGELYKRFHALTAKSFDGASKPANVAAVVVEAVNVAKPKVRYKVGKDSKAMCFLSWLLPRRWFEGITLKAFESALK